MEAARVAIQQARAEGRPLDSERPLAALRHTSTTREQRRSDSGLNQSATEGDDAITFF